MTSPAVLLPCPPFVQTRVRIRLLRERLSVGLEALEAAVAGNPQHAAQHLGEWQPLALPLMSSPIVGECSTAWYSERDGAAYA